MSAVSDLWSAHAPSWMDVLPKTGSRKILERELRRPFWAGRITKV